MSAHYPTSLLYNLIARMSPGLIERISYLYEKRGGARRLPPSDREIERPRASSKELAQHCIMKLPTAQGKRVATADFNLLYNYLIWINLLREMSSNKKRRYTTARRRGSRTTPRRSPRQCFVFWRVL